MGSLTKAHLIGHMRKFQNAVVIVGPKVLKRQMTDEELDKCEEHLTNRMLRREPEKFWDFYRNTFLTEDLKEQDADLAIKALYEKGLIKRIYTQNMAPILQVPATYLHGRDDDYKCTKCQIRYPDEYANMMEIPVCEVCGKGLRPNILFVGENYDDDVYHQLKEDLVSTNTLFLVGFDYDETPIADLVFQFAQNKDMKNSLNDPEQMTMIISVGGADLYDIEEHGNFEFYVKGDVNESMRLLME